MNNRHFTASLSMENSPQAVFDAIANVRGWWSQAVEGDTDRLGAVFYHHYQDVHRCTLKITEFAPSRKITWRVLHNHFSFIKDPTEWNGSDVIFDIAKKGDETQINFTHVGLEPAHECYDVCSNAWRQYINGSLRKLITTGNGEPNPAETRAGHQEEVVAKVRELKRKMQGARE